MVALRLEKIEFGRLVLGIEESGKVGKFNTNVPDPDAAGVLPLKVIV